MSLLPPSAGQSLFAIEEGQILYVAIFLRYELNTQQIIFANSARIWHGYRTLPDVIVKWRERRIGWPPANSISSALPSLSFFLPSAVHLINYGFGMMKTLAQIMVIPSAPMPSCQSHVRRATRLSGPQTLTLKSSL